jgi:hypothetical protein
MKKILIATSCLLSLLPLGCTIVTTANPVLLQQSDLKEMCVIEDTAVNQSFLPAYKAELEKKGFSVRILSPGSDVGSCPFTSTYVGRWSWDFVPYMAYAELVVYRNGTKAGDALYDAPRAGWALTTKIYEATETKIAGMVGQLFPDTGYSK